MAITVNGERIGDDLIEREAEQMRPQYYETMRRDGVTAGDEELEAQLMQWARENLIERCVLRQAALNDPTPVSAKRRMAAQNQLAQQFGGRERLEAFIAESPEAAEAMGRNIEAQLKIEAYLERLTGAVPAPTPEDVAGFYHANPEAFKIPAAVRARHIVKHLEEGMGEAARTQARAAVEAALAELRAGVSFEEVCAKVSDCDGNGGDLGFFSRGDMVERFEEVVFALEPGQLSEVFETEFGFHVARLEERHPERMASLEDAAERIAEHLAHERREQAVQDHLDELMTAARVEEAPEPV